MKRSSLRRPAPERKRSPLIPMRDPVRSVLAPAGGIMAQAPKSVPVRDEGYRRWVASLPCIACGVAGYSQAAHPNRGKGLGTKTDDTDCFPLCCDRPGIVGCHAAFDRLHGITLSQRRELEEEYITRTKAQR